VARLLAPALAATLLALPVAGCSSETEGPATHSHAGGALVSLPVGDGTRAEEVGYSLADVSLPARAGVAGQVRLRVVTYEGEPLTDYLEELTKELHLYVVSDDLTVFRHLHPTMSGDGTWRAPVVLPKGGDYRVVAEFVARDSGGNGDHLVLGETRTVADGAADSTPTTDRAVQVEVTEAPVAGPDGRMRLTVRDARGRPVLLGTYLGAHAHVTGFRKESGSMLHVHPLGAPEVTEDGSTLEFHTEIEEPGDYRLFAQVRVDGFLHTVPVDVEVAAPSA